MPSAVVENEAFQKVRVALAGGIQRVTSWRASLSLRFPASSWEKEGSDLHDLDVRTRRAHVATGLLLEVLGILLAVGTIYLFRDAIVDDAFISLRYARNWLAGQGLVYNPGEYVEGYTNLGFLLATAGLGALGMDLVAAARILGLFGAIIAVILAPRVVMGLREDRVLGTGLARLLCLSNFAFVFMAWTGMETCFFAGVIALLAWICASHDDRFTAHAGLVAGYGFLVRPEGILVGLLLVGYACWRHGWRGVARGGGPWLFAGIVAAAEIWRFVYYGALVPNTALVKGFTRLPADLPWYGAFGDDLVEFLSQTGGAAGLLLILLALGTGRRGLRWVPAVGVCVAMLLFEIYSGGDWMLCYRYLLPMLPFYASLVAAGIVQMVRLVESHRAGQVLRLSLLAAVIVLAVGNWGFALQFRSQQDEYPQFVMTSRDMACAGQWLAEHYPSSYQVTCWRIGALGYYSKLEVIDTIGLTDRTIARARGNEALRRRYLQGRRPELVITEGRPGVTPQHARDFHGVSYKLVQEFRQGIEQTWCIYERNGDRSADR